MLAHSLFNDESWHDTDEPTALTADGPDDLPPPTISGEPIQMIALDLDGTLLRSDKSLSRRSRSAIAEAMKRGVRVVLASARPPRSVRDIYHQLGLDTLQINYNGALIHDQPKRQHLYHRPLPASLARQIAVRARELDPAVSISVELLDRWYTDHVDDNLPTETGKAFRPDFLGPLEVCLKRPVTKLMLLAPPQRLAPVRAAISVEFHGRIATTMSDDHLLQIIHPAVDKARALAKVARCYGVAPERVMAVGDAANDLGMLQWAGIGVAMGNAWPAVRRAADVTVPHNDADGVAFAIDHYVLGRN